MTLKDDILAVGPKEVRTPNMTVVAHDIDKINKVMERRSLVEAPMLCNLVGCRTAPKASAYKFQTACEDTPCDC